MGVLSGKDLYSSKWITADITDSNNQVYYIPIKHTIGRDYFLADIDGKLYCFRIEGSRIKTWQKTLARSFRKLYYDTSHYMPISPADVKEIADVLRKNDLPKVDKNLWKVFKIFGNREKKEFEAHDLLKLQELISNEKTKSEKFRIQSKNLITFLENLSVDKIITPVKKIADFIEYDLKTTDPGFIGDLFTQAKKVEIEERKITNTPLNVKTPWMKVLLLLLIVGTILFAIYYLWDTGAFEDINLLGIPGVESEADQLMSKYPTPEALRDAVDSGELEYDELPKDIKSMIDKIDKLPTATPKT